MINRAPRLATFFTLVPVLLLAGCGLRGLHVPQSPLLKLFELNSGHIAYVGVGGNLFVSNQTGSSEQLTNDAQTVGGNHVSYVAPTWAPNGEMLAFARYLTDPSNGSSTATVQVIDVRTRVQTTLFTTATMNPFYLDWSPTGTYISILSDRGGGRLQLGVVNTDAADSYRPLDSGAPYYSTWSPDGEAIVAHADFTETSGGRVSLIPLASGAPGENLTERYGFFQTPASMPGGRIIAAVEGPGGLARLAVLSPKSGVERYLTAPSRQGFLLSLSPDRRYLAYLESNSAAGNTKSTLHVLDTATGKSLRTIDALSTVGFYWSPDSSRIAFLTPAAGKTVDRSYAQVPSLPHVTLRVLRVETGKSWSIATFPPTQWALTTLPYTDQYQRSQTMWAPDGKHLVYTAYASDGLPGVFVADSSGNVAPRKIASGDSASWSWK